MEPKVLARAGAVILVALLIAAACLELSRKDSDPRSPADTTDASAETSLREDLLRCSELGESALRTPSCQKVWAENRDRFLHGRPHRMPVPGKGAALPESASAPSLAAPDRSNLLP